MDHAHLTKLLDAYLDGGMTVDEKAELEEALLSSEEARTEFWRRAKLHSALATLAADDLGEEMALTETGKEVIDIGKGRRSPWLIPTAAAAAIVIGLVAFFLQNNNDTLRDPSQESIASIARLAETVWQGTEPVETADIIASTRELILESGLAEIQFSSGARAIVQGPAQFTLVTSMHFDLESGLAEFFVPKEAVGFLVSTPTGTMRDLGTRFTAKATSPHRSELHVREGIVNFSSIGPSSTRLTTGQAMFSTAGGLGTIPFAPSDLESELRLRTRYSACQQQRNRLIRATNVLAYFTFEDIRRNPREVRNLSSRSGVPARAVAETLLKATPGRWPNQPAVSFAEISDRVEMRIDGLYPQVTFAAWVKPAPKPWGDNALFMGEHNLTGEAQWAIDARGRITFGVRPPKTKAGAEFTKSSRAGLDPKDDPGKWIHLATTYDADSRQVIHFVNGSEAGRDKLKTGTPVQFGRATLGNRQRFTRAALAELGLTEAWAKRNWSGAIDEFLLLARVLSPAEIQELFTQGRAN